MAPSRRWLEVFHCLEENFEIIDLRMFIQNIQIVSMSFYQDIQNDKYEKDPILYWFTFSDKVMDQLMNVMKKECSKLAKKIMKSLQNHEERRQMR